MTVNWEHHAQFIVSKFRGIYSRYLGDERLTELVSDLQRISPEFCEWWSRHDVYQKNAGRKEYEHPTVGRLAFAFSVFHPEGAPDLRFTVYNPLPDLNTQKKFQKLKAMQVSQIKV
jgi:hypothetical protein